MDVEFDVVDTDPHAKVGRGHERWTHTSLHDPAAVNSARLRAHQRAHQAHQCWIMERPADPQ